MKQKYVAYLRESTKKQEDSGLGFDAQWSLIKSYIGEDDIKLVIKETASGASMDNRSGLKEAMDYARDTGAILCVAKADRLTRDLRDSLEIMEYMNWNVFCCDLPRDSEGKMNEMLFAMTMLMAQAEREWIAARTKVALQEKKKQGFSFGPGYKDGERPDEEKMKRIVEKRKETMRKSKPRNGWNYVDAKICEVLIEYVQYRNRYMRTKRDEEPTLPVDYAAAAKRLNEMGVKSKNGLPISVSNVEDTHKRKFNKYYTFAGRWSHDYKQIKFPPKSVKYKIIKGDKEIINTHKEDVYNEDVHNED